MLNWTERRLLVALIWTALARTQTTQAIISGSVVDSRTGDAIPGAEIRVIQRSSETTYLITGRSDGSFTLPLLPPDTYRVRVEAGGDYQAQELYNLELPVSANLDLRFQLRPKRDVLEQYQRESVFLPNSKVLVIIGPDVDTSRTGSFYANRGRIFSVESSISNVIDPAQITELPLQGRDVYTMISTQPGVASDNAINRGVGVSVNGQRPSSSNFMLDGLQNNNYLTTGPLALTAPEAIQEFRLSTNNFTAEYGGTTGFLANAVTRRGGSAWHGLGYSYMRRTGLNAGDFQRNGLGKAKLPMHELEPGFRAGGPLGRARSFGALFGSMAFDALRFRSESDAQSFTIPTSLFQPVPNTTAAYLLQHFPPPAVADPTGATATLMLSPRISLNRYVAIPRVDDVLRTKHRLFARVAVNRLSRPDLVWSPYTQFNVPLAQNTATFGAGWTAIATPSLINEVKFGIGSELLSILRPHPEVPDLQAAGVIWPGSRYLFDLSNRDANRELIDNLTWSRGGHEFKFGGSLLARSIDSLFTFENAGFYVFAGLSEFANDRIQSVDFTALRPPTAAGDPPSERPPLPDPNHRYTYFQVASFAQDAWRISRRLSINYGVRYENFGNPRIAARQTELLLTPAAGIPIADQLGRNQFETRTSGALYASEKNNWSLRSGFAYTVSEGGRTLLRGAYGIYYDRPFDNYWFPVQANGLLRAESGDAGAVDYLKAITYNLSQFHSISYDVTNPAYLTGFSPLIRIARVQSYFAGVQQEITRNISLEVDGLGSRGNNLITTDQINRVNSVTQVAGRNPLGLINPGLPPQLFYRESDGHSRYDGLIVQANLRAARGQFHLAYALSRSYDHQSDPLSGDFLNLDFTATGVPGNDKPQPYFTLQFHPESDWGRSDFDQRHNLVLYSLWQVPELHGSKFWSRLIARWSVSQMSAIRSGLPFSVIALVNNGPIMKDRANLVLPASSVFERQPWSGGVKLLNAAAFVAPGRGALGNTARNQFAGPGFWSTDLSLSREFPLSRSKEALRAVLRADAFNVFNHANLNNPDAYLQDGEQFGVAQYGRSGNAAAFPNLVPFDEAARQVQLMLRIQF
jgi:hypothetical protein